MDVQDQFLESVANATGHPVLQEDREYEVIADAGACDVLTNDDKRSLLSNIVNPHSKSSWSNKVGYITLNSSA